MINCTLAMLILRCGTTKCGFLEIQDRCTRRTRQRPLGDGNIWTQHLDSKFGVNKDQKGEGAAVREGVGKRSQKI